MDYKERRLMLKELRSGVAKRMDNRGYNKIVIAKCLNISRQQVHRYLKDDR